MGVLGFTMKISGIYPPFEIEDMKEYDLNLLEKHSGGLNRTYPRYCPNFSVDAITQLINKYLNLMN